MFGTNPVAKKRHEDGHLMVQEIFYTIQGEGPFTGMPAVFVRLADCNLRCRFCDTDFTSKRHRMSYDQVVKAVVAADDRHAPLVVFTGGEPLLQEIGEVCATLIDVHHYKVQIETAGTVWPDSLSANQLDFVRGNLSIVCSPKTPGIHPEVAHVCRHYKYIIGADTDLDPRDDLPAESPQDDGRKSMMLYRARMQGVTIWVQPQEHHSIVFTPEDLARGKALVSQAPDVINTQKAIARCAKIAMKRGYRLSLQTHKVLGLP